MANFTANRLLNKRILCYHSVMNDLNASLDNLKTRYREIFQKSVDEIQKRIDEIKPDIDGNIFDEYPPQSLGRKWQRAVIDMLENDISKDLYIKFQEVLAYRKNFKCVGCATCCNLACSEFSPEELRQKAQNGDNFAKQFLSVFIPYNSKEEARAVYPDYIELLEEHKEDNVYFYHCPKLTKDNRCSDYENRPDICRKFPDNPLSLLPSKCGYRQWKEEVEPLTLMLHSMIEIIDYYKEKIKC